MKRTSPLIAVLALSVSAWGADFNADNTGKNTRDQNGDTVTPIDQSNDPNDIKMTADIRKMVMADESLSALAKNVKIITASKVVTLRGPTETQKEKTAIATHAGHVKPKKVINEIEIKSNAK